MEADAEDVSSSSQSHRRQQIFALPSKGCHHVGSHRSEWLTSQEFESIQMLDEMLDRPQDFWTVIKRYTTSIGSTVIFGKRYPVLESPSVKTLYAVSLHTPRRECTQAVIRCQ